MRLTKKELILLKRIAVTYELSEVDGQQDPPFKSPDDFISSLESAIYKLNLRLQKGKP
jgi:hypothetical protein